MSHEDTLKVCKKIAEHFYSDRTISSPQIEVSDALAGN